MKINEHILTKQLCRLKDVYLGVLNTLSAIETLSEGDAIHIVELTMQVHNLSVYLNKQIDLKSRTSTSSL